MSPKDEVLAPFVEAMREERMRHRVPLNRGFDDRCTCGWELPDDHGLPGWAVTKAWYSHVEECALRAALGVEPTKACETCGGHGDTAPFTRELTHPCPDCVAGRVSDPEGLRLIVAREVPADGAWRARWLPNAHGPDEPVFLAVHPETGSENR